MKYIMFERELHTGLKQLIPIVFPADLVHADIATAMRAVPGMSKAIPIRAGEYSPMADETSGRSETLGLESSEADANTIAMHDYLHGY